MIIASLLMAFHPVARADFDVNAIAGQVYVDGEAAPSGTAVNVTDVTKGVSIISVVDGPNIPPFIWGRGRYDTGDVPQFDSGDIVVVTCGKSGHLGTASATLAGGTTTVDLALLTMAAAPPGGSGEAEEGGLARLQAENLALRAENEALQARLRDCEGGYSPLDYMASIGGSNLSEGSTDGIAYALCSLLEEAYWSVDYAARTMGTRTIGVLGEAENVSASLWDTGGNVLDSLLQFIPVLMDGRVLAMIAAMMAVGFGLTVLVVGRDARRRLRQRLEAMREEKMAGAQPPFWDDIEV